MESERVVNAGLLGWEKFKRDFLDILFPPYMKEEKVLDFINIYQVNMSV